MDSNSVTPQQRILQRKNALWRERASHDAHCQDIADFILPRAARFYSQDKNRGGAQHYNSIIDNTGTMAHGTLSAGLMAGMTSPARPWFKLATPDRDLMEYAPVKVWLHKVTLKMLAIFAKSNTYRAFHSIYDQIGAFGVAASVVANDFDNVLHHYPQTFGTYALGLDSKGRVDTLYREMSKTVSQLVEEFGRENCSQTVRNLYDRGSFDEAVQVLHAIEPRRDREYGKRDAKNMPWKSCMLELGRDDDRKFLRESGFLEFPVIAPRWIVDGDDTYSSRWPGAVALGDVKQLQQEQLQKSNAIDYKVNPPLGAPASLKTAGVDTLPGGMTYYDSSGPHATIKSLYEVNLDLQHLLGDIQDVRLRINQAFYADLFRMLIDSDRREITAREVAEKHEEKLLMIGPVLERLINEALSPKIDMTFAKMNRAGMFAPGSELEPPAELQGVDLDVEFVGTLAQAQRAVGASSVDRLIGTISSLTAVWPDAADKLDFDEAVDTYAENLGVPPGIVRGTDEIEQLRAARAQQKQAEAAAMMAQPALQAAQAGKAMGETDPEQMSDVMAAFTGYGGTGQ